MTSKVVEALDLALLLRVMRERRFVSFRARGGYRRLAFTLSGGQGEARLLLPGDGGTLHRRPLVRFQTPYRLRFGRPGFDKEETYLIERGLRLLDPQAKLRRMNASGAATVVKIFGVERPITERAHFVVELPEAEMPAGWIAIARDLHPELTDPSPAAEAEGVLF